MDRQIGVGKVEEDRRWLELSVIVTLRGSRAKHTVLL